MKRSLITLSVVSLMLAGVAGAAVQQGETEAELSGSFQYQNFEGGGNQTVFNIAAGLGYFVTDNIRLGGDVLGAWSEGTSMYGIGVNAKFHFMPTNQWVPYVGGQFAFAWVDTDFGNGTTYLYGPVAGLRYELNANNDLFLEYQFQLYSGDAIYDNVHALFFGIVHIFKK